MFIALAFFLLTPCVRGKKDKVRGRAVAAQSKAIAEQPEAVSKQIEVASEQTAAGQLESVGQPKSEREETLGNGRLNK